MAANAESPLDLLWKEYSLIFREFDDLTLARWLSQTLGQLAGKSWRLSHPLLGAYRLGLTTWSRTADLAQAPCNRATRILGLAVLSRADAAAADARR